MTTASEIIGYEGEVILGKSEEEAYLVDNPNRRCPDITKAREQLGFDPEITIDDGLRRSLIWYAHNRTGSEA